MKRRLFAACMIVLAGLGAIVGIDAFVQRSPDPAAVGDRAFESGASPDDEGSAAEGDGAATQRGPAIGDGGAVDAHRADTVILSLDALARERGFATVLPDVFTQEAFGDDGFETVLAARDGSSVGILCRGTARALYDRLCGKLEENGWIHIESGQETVGTFVKEEGSLSWLLLSCSETGEWASAAVQMR